MVEEWWKEGSGQHCSNQATANDALINFEPPH